MKPIQIDKATPADIAALTQLLSELFSQEQEFIPNAETQARGLMQIINHPATGTIFVARQDDKIVGMVNLLFTASTAVGERVALLEDMIVSNSVRDTGIGSQLLSKAISYAESEGCKRITLLTDKTNDKAQRFYNRQGFALSTMVPMRLTLEPAKNYG